jgi:hypothetical protein
VDLGGGAVLAHRLRSSWINLLFEEAPMVIDFTAELAPILWAIVALLLFLGGAIVATFEAEVAEIYLGNRGLLVAVTALLVVTIVGLVVAQAELIGVASP